MTRLTLNDDQAESIRSSNDTVEIRDPSGNLLG